jgi:putative membrane protein
VGISALWGARLNDDDGYQLERGVIRMFWYDHDMGWWGYAGMGVGMVLFWALIVAGIVGLVMFVSGDRRTSQPPPSSQQILGAR